MGHLLSSAIKMQGGVVANPTLVVNFTQNYGGACGIAKNGVFYGSAVPGANIVPIVAGDTFQIGIEAAFEGSAIYVYYVNDVFITSGFTFSSLDSAIYTASGTNAYRFEVTTDFGA
jgi:hypothetical protein